MSIKIMQLIFFPVKGYQDIYRRSYNSHVDGAIEQQLIDSTNNGAQITKHSLSGVASQILRPSSNIGNMASMVHGWQTPRYRFLLKVEEEGQLGVSTIAFYTGYTEHSEGIIIHGIDSVIDPNMYMHVTSVSRTRISNVQVGAVPSRNFNNVGNQQFLFGDSTAETLAGNVAGTYWKMRPEDVFRSQNLLNSLSEVGLTPYSTIDTTGSLTALGGDVSSRENNVASSYLSKTLRALRNAHTDYESSATDATYDAAKAVNEGYISYNPFFNVMMNYAEAILNSGRFRYGDLQKVASYLDDVTNVFSSNNMMQYTGQQSAGMTLNMGLQYMDNVPSADNTEHWKGSTTETIVAYNIAMALPAMMLDKFVSSFRINITNQTLDGSIQHAIMDISPIDPLLEGNMMVAGETLADQITMEILGPNSNFGALPFRCMIDCNVFGDTSILISFNGAPDTPYVMPTFADNMATPIITADRNVFQSVTNDIYNITEGLVTGRLAHAVQFGRETSRIDGTTIPLQQQPQPAIYTGDNSIY